MRNRDDLFDFGAFGKAIMYPKEVGPPKAGFAKRNY